MGLINFLFKRFIHVFTLVFILCISCENDELNFDTKELENVHIGLYADAGATDIDKVEEMLKQLDCFYLPINRDSILESNLNNYDIILFPGGDMWIYKSHLSMTGVQKLKNYVQQGGGYIGICGGSYFAANKIVWRGWADEPRQYLTIAGLGLFSGTADGPIEDFAPSYQDNNCKVNIEQNHPITLDISQQIDYLYSFGPKFLITDSSDVTILGRSVVGNNTVVIAVKCQQGRVFLTALHPEFDNDKSSWKMIRNAILWCSGKL